MRRTVSRVPLQASATLAVKPPPHEFMSGRVKRVGHVTTQLSPAQITDAGTRQHQNVVAASRNERKVTRNRRTLSSARRMSLAADGGPGTGRLPAPPVEEALRFNAAEWAPRRTLRRTAPDALGAAGDRARGLRRGTDASRGRHRRPGHCADALTSRPQAS